MYEVLHNIMLVALVVFAIGSFVVAALIGYSRFKLKGLLIKKRKLNEKFIDRWFYTSVIVFGSVLFVAELGDFLQLFLAHFGENDLPLWAVVLTYALVFLISVAYGCLLIFIEDLSSRIRFYNLERIVSSKIDEQVKKEADEEAERLERILQL